MARCKNYATGEQVQVGTSMKNLQQYSFYCMATPGVRKIGNLATWTGSTPKWCPLGRDEKGE